MQNDIYNSRSVLYKKPFGAVSTGTPIEFTVYLPMDLVYSTVTLLLHSDQKQLQFPLKYLETKGDEILYRTTVTLDQADVYFYLFQVEQGEKSLYIKHKHAGVGIISDSGEGVDYQLTVYKSDYTTPDSVKGGIFYQIFPDRFYKSNQPKQNVPSDRILRSDWGGTPHFLPNERGEILNNDYFGGDLKGIEEKLPYLESLGVTLLYLNPIFEAHSNHRYNTADYRKIDPLLGTEEDFVHLCQSAKKRGIGIILDGVFSHTGSDSIYFNKEGRYPSIGAYNSQDSPYYPWFKFIQYPDVYHSWWGFATLPEIDKHNPDYIEFICGEDGVIRHWLRLGASGFRLDVADELPDDFIVQIRKAMKKENPESLLIGEVWEDASNKMAYGVRRHYFMGDELDSVMNYPFKQAILDFIKDPDKDKFINNIMTIVENYPFPSLHTTMNSLSTHDTERAITYLAGPSCQGKDRAWQSHHPLTVFQYRDGVRMLKMAMVLQFFLPGIPCIYYGDEAGMQGYKDPFNRGCYPWGTENKDLLEFTRRLGQFRNQCPALKSGTIEFLDSADGTLLLQRTDKEGSTVLCLNYSDQPQPVSLPLSGFHFLSGKALRQPFTVSPIDFVLLVRQDSKK